MNAPPLLPEPPPPLDQTLRRLFLTLFLRGRSARGLKWNRAPGSLWQKLLFTLLFYTLFGCIALALISQPRFALSVYLHSMTLALLGMFVAASAGEILFNKEEADILMHRPVGGRVLLWAKIRVLVEVSLWLAGAFNLVGLVAMAVSRHGDWRFSVAHVVSVALEALFCAGSVVLIYQLCLRWFGRERLDGLMTTAQVLMTIGVVLSGQILPRIMFRFTGGLDIGESPVWIGFLPPVWFAGFDDALAGTHSPRAWLLAGVGVLTTGLVLWLAFGRLAKSYETGVQMLNETVSPPVKHSGRRRWLSGLAEYPPLSWWLRDPVSRASFLLTAAYLLRDRDVKLRLYPGLAPMLVFPFIFMFQNPGGGHGGGFGLAMSGVYAGMIPLIGLNLLQFSQQWQAADVFRVAPLVGPAALCHGARRAVLLLLTFPLLLVFVGVALALKPNVSQLVMLLPGLVALPIYAILPSRMSGAVPLSKPTEEAKSAGRGLWMFLAMMLSFGLAGLAVFARSQGWFGQFLLVETVCAAGLYAVMRRSLARMRWESME